DDWPRCCSGPARLALVVRYRSRHARRRVTLSARGRSALWPVRAGHGPVLCIAGCRAAALATAGEPDAVGDGGGWRLAGVALERQPVACLLRPGRGTRGVRADQRWSGRVWRLVRPHWLAVAARGACTKEIIGADFDECGISRRTVQRTSDLEVG